MKPMHLLTSLLLFCSLWSFGQSPDCERFKMGKFVIEASQVSGQSLIVRDGKYQIETMEGMEGSFKFKVKWLDECTYTLTPTKETLKKLPHVPDNGMMKIEIIETGENYYIHRVSSNYFEAILTGKMFKVE